MPFWRCSATRKCRHYYRHQYNPALSRKTFRRCRYRCRFCIATNLSIQRHRPLAPTLSIFVRSDCDAVQKLFGLNNATNRSVTNFTVISVILRVFWP